MFSGMNDFTVPGLSITEAPLLKTLNINYVSQSKFACFLRNYSENYLCNKEYSYKNKIKNVFHKSYTNKVNYT